jgi:type II secretory pathway component PulJ
VTRRAARHETGRTAGPRRDPVGESGFTLIEMLAVASFTALLMLFAVNFYIEISRASEVAAEHTGETRRAIAILDRIARDLEGAVLVQKPDELDPLSHPWVFLAEDRGWAEGADHLKFATRSRIPRSSALHESDLEVVSYVLREAEDERFELLRWASPRLPEELDRSFPESEAEGAVLFAESLGSFGVRLLGADGQWKSEWDSSTLIDASELPLAAEISLALLPEDGAEQEEEPELYVRRVLLPVRPLDLAALLEGADGATSEEEDEDAEEDEDCVTVEECRAQNSSAFEAAAAAIPGLGEEINSARDDCFSTSPFASIPGVQGCE